MYPIASNKTEAVSVCKKEKLKRKITTPQPAKACMFLGFNFLNRKWKLVTPVKKQMRKIDQGSFYFWKELSLYIVPSYNIKVFECIEDLMVRKAYN